MNNKLTKIKYNNTHSVKVCCIETGEIFNTIKEASIKTKANRDCISACCKGKQNTANKLHWKYI